MCLHAGQIYLANLGNDDKHPVLVVSREGLNRGNDVVGIPLTSKKFEKRRALRNCVPFLKGEFGLWKDCVAQAELIQQIRVNDLRDLVGTVDDETMRDVVRAIGCVIDADCEPT